MEHWGRVGNVEKERRDGDLDLLDVQGREEGSAKDVSAFKVEHTVK